MSSQASPGAFHPTITAYKSVDDLVTLKSWFYPQKSQNGPDLRQRAVRRVRAFASRGRVPHAVEMTSLLISTKLMDEDNKTDMLVLQLAYAMAIIRFVNGLLDPLQLSTYAMPLTHLAKSIGVPNYFVELRHMGTHDGLPSLSLLRIACARALQWLHDAYWVSINDHCVGTNEEQALDEREPTSIREQNPYLTRQEKAKIREEQEKKIAADIVLDERHIHSITGQIQHKINTCGVIESVKKYRAFRRASNTKSDLLCAINRGSKTTQTFSLVTSGIMRVKMIPPFLGGNLLHGFNTFSGADLVIHTLIFSKTSGFDRKEYVEVDQPLLSYLGKPFMCRLFLTICDLLWRHFSSEAQNLPVSRILKDVGFYISGEAQAVQLSQWLGYLVKESSNDSTVHSDTISIGAQLQENPIFELTRAVPAHNSDSHRENYQNSIDSNPRGIVTKENTGLRYFLLSKLEKLVLQCPLSQQCLNALTETLSMCSPVDASIKSFIQRVSADTNILSYRAPPSLQQLLAGASNRSHIGANGFAEQPTVRPEGNNLNELFLSPESSIGTRKRRVSDDDINVKRSRIQNTFFLEEHSDYRSTPFGILP